jgi:UrcA family protein
MTTTALVAKTANLAMYALAALPIIALSTARAEPATVKISDLNLSRPAHVAQFNQRLDRATDQICAGYAERRNLTPAAACASAVRSEAMDKLSQAQRQTATVSVASR